MCYKSFYVKNINISISDAWFTVYLSFYLHFKSLGFIFYKDAPAKSFSSDAKKKLESFCKEYDNIYI